MDAKEKCLSLMDKTVSVYALFVALWLIIFMLSTFSVGVINFIRNFYAVLVVPSGVFDADKLFLIQKEVLNGIALAIVMIKAYVILISYAKTHHINLKLLVEIAIIAPTIELIFNINSYDVTFAIIMSLFAFANLVVYIYFYERFKAIDDDYEPEGFFRKITKGITD